MGSKYKLKWPKCILKLLISLQSDQSDRPSLIAVYLSHNVSGEEIELKLPAVDSGSYNISSVPRGKQYGFAMFGENVFGNGTETKASISKYSEYMVHMIL